MTTFSCLPARGAFYTWLARGAAGFALLAVAASTAEPLVAIPALLAALVTFRGCPMCWVCGLIEREDRSFAPSTRKDAS